MSNDISSESTERCNPKKSCIPLEMVSTKVVKRIVKFQIFGFLSICFFVFVNMGRYGNKITKDISSKRTQQICFPKSMYTPGEGLYQSSSRIVKFKVLLFFSFFWSYFGLLTW